MLNIETSALIIIDVQEKLVKAANNGAATAINAAKLAKAANALEIPAIITEQYPKGLGSTVTEVKENLSDNAFIAEKSAFSALLESNISEKIQELKSAGVKQIIICGIETHICVLQTVMALRNEGFEVHVVENASSSRSVNEHNTGLALMKQHGAYVTTVEIVLFELLKTSRHPKFKEIQALIK